MSKTHRSKRGQTLVEFAFILVLLLILVFGIFEFSIILYDKAIITNASREGARAGAVFRADPNTGAYLPWTQTEIRAVVNNYLQNRLVTFGSPSSATTTVTTTGTPPSQGGTDGKITVNVAFTYSYLILPKLGSIGGGTLNLASTSIMRTE